METEIGYKSEIDKKVENLSGEFAGMETNIFEITSLFEYIRDNIYDYADTNVEKLEDINFLLFDAWKKLQEIKDKK